MSEKYKINPKMNLQFKFGNFMATQTFNIAQCKRGGITDKQTEGWTIRLLDAPADFPGHKKNRG